jgi:RND family efflux transporter MFP subunit
MKHKPLVMALAAAAHVVAAAAALAAPASRAADDPPPALASVAVALATAPRAAGYDGVVEALRQTVVAAQVPGAIVALQVKVGDRVRAGQVLLRLDARAAEQQAGAAAAQVQAARAAQDVATKEFERQKLLHQKDYISQAALDRAEAQYRSALAQAAAQQATAGAARTESGFYLVKAPYEGIVSEVAVVLGDMAMPGRPLLTLYDPAALRVTAAVPQTVALRLAAGAAVQAELPAAGAAGTTGAAGAAGTTGAAGAAAALPGNTGGRIQPLRWQVLPALDPATHTVQVRLDLPAGTAAAPGMFARVWLPGATSTGTGAVNGADAARLSVPARAVVRRAELTGVYVIAPDGRPLLRQVRLGPTNGDQVEVLSGLAAGERVALDPQAAARAR